MYGTACEQVYISIGQHAYPARLFDRHEELHAFDTRVSRLLAQTTMLASYATCDFYVLTRIPTRYCPCIPCDIANLLASSLTQ